MSVRLGGRSKDAVDRRLLLIGEGVGAGIGGSALPRLRGVHSAIVLIGSTDKLDRRQDHQHRPKQRHPAAGEKRGEADAEHPRKDKAVVVKEAYACSQFL